MIESEPETASKPDDWLYLAEIIRAYLELEAKNRKRKNE